MTDRSPAPPTVGPLPPWRFPAAVERTLPNGLRLVGVDLPGKTLGAAVLTLDAPIDAEPAGSEGALTLAANCLDEGAAGMDSRAFAEALQHCGASLDTRTGSDGISVTLEAPLRHWAEALRLLCAAVTEPAFDEPDLERVRQQRLSALAAERVQPGARAAREARASLFAPDPRLALPSAGTAETVAALVADDVRRLYRTLAVPATASLVFAGDFAVAGGDPLEALASVFTAWAGTGDPQPIREPLVAGEPGTVIVDRPDAAQTQLVWSAPAPHRSSPDWAALGLGVFALGGTLTSRIDRLLREEKGYTYGIRSSVDASRRHGVFSISGSVESSTTAQAVPDLLDIVRTTAARGITAEELEAARAYTLGVAPLRWETARGLATHLAAVITAGLPSGWTVDHLEAVRRADVAEVNRALAEHVHPDRLTMAFVGAAHLTAEAVAALGRAPDVVPL